MTSKSQHIDRLYHREPSPAGPSRQSRLWALTLIVVLSAVLLTGCTKEKEKSGWDEIETYFDEPLASLSAEGDSVHWIGGEYGDLWSMTARGRKHYKLDTATADWRNIGSTAAHSAPSLTIPSPSKASTTRSTTSGGKPDGSMRPPVRVSSC